MAIPFGTDAWAQALCAHLNGSSEYRNAAAKWGKGFNGTLLLSFGAVGVPQGGVAFSTLPAYMAAGIPIEGIVVLEATAMAPDMLKTVLNVTGDMSVATLLSRANRGEAAESIDIEPVPAVASESMG